MGSGKSTLGRRLAALLRLPFLDLDDAFEAAAGMSIAEFFAAEGEAEFRRLEAQVLGERLRAEPQVLATGGGAILNPQNRVELRRASWVIWLDPSFETIREHIGVDAGRRRPLVEQLGFAGLRNLHQARRPYYAETAHLRSGVEKIAPARLARELSLQLDQLQTGISE